MYCKTCGTVIDDAAAFCVHCGQKITELQDARLNVPIKKGILETIVIESLKEDEQKTINRYVKFGWILRNNQEVNVTTTHGGGASVNGTGSTYISSVTKTYIKLTFERNAGMANFQNIDALYKNFELAVKEKERIHADIREKEDQFSLKLFFIWYGVIFAIFAFIFEYVLRFGDEVSILSVSGGLLMGGICGALPAFLIQYIKSSVETKKLKKQYAPTLAQLETEMDMLAEQSVQYIQ